MRKILAVFSFTAFALTSITGTGITALTSTALAEATITYDYPSPSLDGDTQWPGPFQGSIDWFKADDNDKSTNTLIGNAAPSPQKKNDSSKKKTAY